MRNRSGWTKRLILHQWQGKEAKPGGDRAPSLPIDAGAAVPTMRETRSCIGYMRRRHSRKMQYIDRLKIQSGRIAPEKHDLPTLHAIK
ncbi:hypothetical protein [Burkholderia gladioli]|uniref:hypothetical protein n=1 Tax=Burkholderia gladioli TaxID=28095 RepID=UPI002FE09583